MRWYAMQAKIKLNHHNHFRLDRYFSPALKFEGYFICVKPIRFYFTIFSYLLKPFFIGGVVAEPKRKTYQRKLRSRRKATSWSRKHRSDVLFLKYFLSTGMFSLRRCSKFSIFISEWKITVHFVFSQMLFLLVLCFREESFREISILAR